MIATQLTFLSYLFFTHTEKHALNHIAKKFICSSEDLLPVVKGREGGREGEEGEGGGREGGGREG